MFLNKVKNKGGKENDGVVEVESKDAAQAKDWLKDEDAPVGGLSVDVYEDGDYLIIKSTIAGVKPEDVEVVIDGEMLLITGKRSRQEEIKKENYHYQECYWGNFERALRLPIQVESHGIEAQLKGGILTIRLRKARRAEKLLVKVKGE